MDLKSIVWPCSLVRTRCLRGRRLTNFKIEPQLNHCEGLFYDVKNCVIFFQNNIFQTCKKYGRWGFFVMRNIFIGSKNSFVAKFQPNLEELKCFIHLETTLVDKNIFKVSIYTCIWKRYIKILPFHNSQYNWSTFLHVFTCRLQPFFS